MKPRQVLFWLLLLCAAAGAYFLSEEAAEKSEKAADAAKRLVGPTDSLQVRRLTLAGTAYPEEVVLARDETGPGWRLVKPVEAPADGTTMSLLLNAVVDGRVTRKLEAPKPLKDYGLAPPARKLTLEAKDGKSSELWLGDATADGGSIYAAPGGGDEVWLLPAGLAQTAAKSVFDLRDKSVLAFRQDLVERLELTMDGATVKLVRRQAGADPLWDFAGGGEASPSEIDRILTYLGALKALGFVDRGVDPAAMGLQNPRGKVVLGLKAEEGKPASELALLIGGKDEKDNQVYLRRAEGGPVMLLAEAGLDNLKVTRDGLIERRVLKVKRHEITALEIVRGEDKLAFARRDGQWVRTVPAPDQPSSLSLFLWDLVELKWQKLLPAGGDYGLDRPAAVLTFSAGSAGAEPAPPAGANRKLVLGKVDPASKLLAAQVEGDGRVFGLEPAFLDKLPQREPAAPGPEGKVSGQPAEKGN